MITRIKVRLFFSLIIVALVVTKLPAQNPILKADSLFVNQQYTQAFDSYLSLYDKGQASPAMLLKMAFIKDASDDYTGAVYYLDQYYQLTADREVVGKIEELADANNLMGYRYNDANYFEALMNKYKIQLILILIALILLVFVYLFRKSQKGERAYIAGIILIFLMLGLCVINTYESSQEAVVALDHTLLRSGPSAGGEPVQIISKGHKVQVINRSDVWTKIAWEGEEVYVRNNRLKII